MGEMLLEEAWSGSQAGAYQRDTQCWAAFMSAKTVCAFVKRRYDINIMCGKVLIKIDAREEL